MKEGKEREKERFRDRERQKENKTNNPENYAAHHVFSSKFCRITLNVTDVKRKEAHTQKGRRTILGRFVRRGGEVPGELVHRRRSGIFIHSFIHSWIHACMQQIITTS